MSLRTRAALWTAAAVVLAVLAVAVAARQAAEASLVASVDADLQALAAVAPRAVQEGRTGPGGGRLAELRGEGHGRGRHGAGVLAAADGLVTLLGPDGQPLDATSEVPVSAAAAAIARDGGGPALDTVEVAGDRCARSPWRCPAAARCS
jgi:hypothetical protein